MFKYNYTPSHWQFYSGFIHNVRRGEEEADSIYGQFVRWHTLVVGFGGYFTQVFQNCNFPQDSMSINNYYILFVNWGCQIVKKVNVFWSPWLKCSLKTSLGACYLPYWPYGVILGRISVTNISPSIHHRLAGLGWTVLWVVIVQEVLHRVWQIMNTTTLRYQWVTNLETMYIIYPILYLLSF